MQTHDALIEVDYRAVSIGRKRFSVIIEPDPELKSLFANAKEKISQG